MKYQNLVDAANENLLRLKQEQVGKVAAAQSAIVAHLRQHPLVNTIAGPIIEGLCQSSEWLNGTGRRNPTDQAIVLLRLAGRDGDADMICAISETEPVNDLFRAVTSANCEIRRIDSSIKRVEGIESWMRKQPDLK